MMKAITEKWETTRAVARVIGVPETTIAKWKVRGRVSAFAFIPLINASKGKLGVADFTEQQQDDA